MSVSLFLRSAFYISWANSLSQIISQTTELINEHTMRKFTFSMSPNIEQQLSQPRHHVRHHSETDSRKSVNWSTLRNTDCILARMRLISQPTQRNRKTGCVSHSLGGPKLRHLTVASLIPRLAGGRADGLQFPHNRNRTLWFRVPQKVLTMRYRRARGSDNTGRYTVNNEATLLSQTGHKKNQNSRQCG